MYSEKITQSHISDVESKLSIKLHQYTPAQSLEVLEDLNSNFKPDRSLIRPFRAEELGFIRNEQILCQLSFPYWTRYCSVILDQGGIGPLKLWESQHVLLSKISKLEEQNQAQYLRHEPCDGILIADHKGGRQLGHTAIARALVWHRLTTYPYTRSATIAVDEPGLHKIYEKDELIYSHLPFFLTPSTDSGMFLREKDQHWNFMGLGSNLTYYQAQQRSGEGTGMGTGSTYDIGHLTEVSTYSNAHMLEMDFFPTLPQNPLTLCLLETTAWGRGNWWHVFSEAVRKGKKARWSYLFIPFYAEPTKYRRLPPPNWIPNDTTLQMARKVEETSAEFVGKVVILSREQLYWWESSTLEALESHSLNKFLSNYAIVPEESFQFSTVGALPVQILSWMRTTTKKGLLYELESV